MPFAESEISVREDCEPESSDGLEDVSHDDASARVGSQSEADDVIEDGAETSKECTICGKSFLRPSHLRRHMLSHDTVRSFLCAVCNRPFKQKAHLKRHAINAHGHLLDPNRVLRRKPNVCKCCNKSFNDVWMLKRHCRSLHAGAGLETSQTNFYCDKCGRTDFLSKQHLTNHLQAHLGLRPFACRMCDLSYKRRDELKNHMAAKHSINYGRWHCVLCEETFVQRVQVERHWKARHSTERSEQTSSEMRYKCRHCDDAFAQAKTMQEHIRACHFYRERIDPQLVTSTSSSSDSESSTSSNVPTSRQCTLLLVINIAKDSKPVRRLLLHDSLPVELLRRYRDLVVMEVDLGDEAALPGSSHVLELQVERSCCTIGGNNEEEPNFEAYQLIYRE